MYLDFYALKQTPFHATPDPQFLFLSPTHKAALGAIVHGISARQGLIAIFGEAGMGKTTLLRAYLARVNSQELQTIFVINVHLTLPALLRVIARELGLPPKASAPHHLMLDIQHALREVYTQGRNVALIIDEAQALPMETLEHLRLLANLEVDTIRPLQIVLLGQPELEAQLQQESWQPLEQSTLIRSTIAPLTRLESLRYMQHRLAKVMSDEQPIFTPRALQCMARYAGGIPRVMNALCTNALLAGFATRRKPIPAAVVQRVIAAYHGKRYVPRWQRSLAASVAMLLVVGLTWFAPWPRGQAQRQQVMEEAVLDVADPRPLAAPAGRGETTLVSREVRQAESPSPAPLPTPPASTPPEQDHDAVALPPQALEKAEELREQLDPQAMQGFVARLLEKKRTDLEQLDSRAMQKLLARLETAERPTVAGGLRSKATRKRNP